MIKKIFIFSWRGPKHPNEGGAEIATHEHAKAWVKAGYDVTLFTSISKGLKKEELIDGVNVVRKGGQLGTVYLCALLWYIRQNEKPVLVVDQFHGMPFFTPLYVRAPILGYIHEVAREVWFMNHLKFPLNYLYGVVGYISEPIIFRFFYRNTDFMTVSKSSQEDLVRMGVKLRNVNVIKNGVTTVKVNVKKRKKKTAVYLGALARDKGIEDAIKCFGEINSMEDDWQFWVIGKGDPRIIKEMKQLGKKIGVSGKLKFWGFVSDKEKFELLGKSHVMINPSRREGWGLVNIEANSVGTPVVGYDVPGVRDSIVNGETGIIVKVDDIRALAKAAISVMQNNKYSSNAKSNSRNFTWEESTTQSLKLIKPIILSGN